MEKLPGKGVMAHFLLEIEYVASLFVKVQYHSLPVGDRIG